ncbi:hypothetical protein V6615_08000 [Oscillospiraceae bacterium PP1C4]
MAQNYNVDDILEEIRRKRNREMRPADAPPRDSGTYEEIRSDRPAQSGFREESAPPRRAYHETQNDLPPPAPRHDQQRDYRSRPARPARPVQSRSELGGAAAPYPGGRRGAMSAGQEDAFGVRMMQYPTAPRDTQQEHASQPVRPAEPERGRSFEFVDGSQLPKKPSGRQQFDFDLPDPPSEPAGAEPASKAIFDFDAPLPPTGYSESLQDTMSRVRRDAPAAPRTPEDIKQEKTIQGQGFTFRMPETQPRAEDGFAFPLWEDEQPRTNDSYDSRFVSPEDVPIPDGTRTRQSDAFTEAYTQEMDAQPSSSFRQNKRTNRPQRDGRPESIVNSQWQQGYAAQELLEHEASAEDEFASPEDAPFVAKDIKSIRVGLGVKLLLTSVLAFISIYLTLSLKAFPFAEQLGLNKGLGEGQQFLLPLPTAIFPEQNMQLFLIVNLIVCVLASIVCSNIVGGGIAALCKMRADSDSPAALAMLGVLVQGITLVMMPEAVTATAHVGLYFSVPIVALLFNLIGKTMLIKRVERNFKYLTSGADKYAFVQIQNREFAREFSRGLGPDIDRVAYTAKTDFMTGFLDKSYSSDYSDSFSRLVAPITLLGSLVVGGVTFFFAKDIPVAVSAFTAVLCIVAPFSSAVIPNLMLSKVSKKLTKNGAMLAGYESAEDYSDTSAVVISDKDLFAEDSIMLHGMKVFAEKRIDEAILDAASVILSCDGIMSGVFLNMLGGNKRLLKKVDSLLYEDSMGISAWVDGKRVLIGSNELMRTHGIDCPSRDFESRYVRDGRQVLYIANSGELSAMFVVSYNADPHTAETLCDLERSGISTVVYTTDPNVTSERIAASFGVKRSSTKVLPAKMHGEYAYLARPKERVAANGAHSGGLDGIRRLIKAARAVKQSVISGTIVQLIGVIVGYGLVAFMAFTASLSSASFSTLILFNLAWLALTSIAASVVKR